MKKLFALFFTAILSLGMSAQQYATNFNCNDCSGTNWDLFTELDSGKVVVICWVMPCSACVPSATINMTTSQNYAALYPGRVLYFLCDDTGNNTCNDITTWATSNAITADAMFATDTIDWTDYGIPAMPKTVVLGGIDHHIYYLKDGEVDGHDLTIAIQTALAETGVADQNTSISEINLFPNPSTSGASVISYNLIQPSTITIAVYNMLGEKVKKYFVGNENVGKHEMGIDLTNLEKGIYFLRLSAGETASMIKIVVGE